MNPWDTTPETLERLKAALREHARNLVEPDFSGSLAKRQGERDAGEEAPGWRSHLDEAQVQLPEADEQGQPRQEWWYHRRQEAGEG